MVRKNSYTCTHTTYPPSDWINQQPKNLSSIDIVQQVFVRISNWLSYYIIHKNPLQSPVVRVVPYLRAVDKHFQIYSVTPWSSMLSFLACLGLGRHASIPPCHQRRKAPVVQESSVIPPKTLERILSIRVLHIDSFRSQIQIGSDCITSGSVKVR